MTRTTRHRAAAAPAGALPRGPVADTLAAVVATLREVVDAVQAPTWSVETADLLAEVGLLHDAICAAQAAQTVRVAQFAARDEEWADDGRTIVIDGGVGHVSEFAGDELAPVLGMSPMIAAQKARTDAFLCSSLPGTMRALADGHLDGYRASIVAALLKDVDHETCAAVEAKVYPGLHGATPGRVRARVRRVLADLDPSLYDEAAARAVHDRAVRITPGQAPGMTEWWANLPTVDSTACWAAIDEAAHRMALDDPARTLEQCRADAFVDLILARATVTTTVTIMVPIRADQSADAGARGCAGDGAPSSAFWPDSATVPAPSATGPADSATVTADPATIAADFGVGSCDIPGLGTIPAQVVATLLGRFDTRIGRMLIDEATGTTIETTRPRYRPDEAIAAFVRARDGTCRFPGCARRARRCDLDHVIPWPDGPTAPGNLIALCRHHHRLKTHRAWRPRLEPDGVVVWTDPYGRSWTTTPADHTTTRAA